MVKLVKLAQLHKPQNLTEFFLWQMSFIASTIEIVKVAEKVKPNKLHSLSRLAEVGEMLELA